jgi:hypothetical protein
VEVSLLITNITSIIDSRNQMVCYSSLFYPDLQIEMRIRVQAIDVHSELTKDDVTLWVCVFLLESFALEGLYLKGHKCYKRSFYLGIRVLGTQ